MEMEKKVGNEEICHEEIRRNNLVELRSQTEDIRSIKDSLGGNLDKIRELLALKVCSIIIQIYVYNKDVLILCLPDYLC